MKLYRAKGRIYPTVTLDYIKSYCLAKGAWLDFPFDFETMVFKVGKKMFALIGSTGRPVAMNLKCDPFLAMDLRERYRSVTPGYHMNKAHWNTVVDDGSIPKKEVLAMIDHSYDLVYKSLSRADKEKIERGEG